MTTSEHVTIREGDWFGYYIYAPNGHAPVAVCFTLWGARWAARRLVRRLRRGLIREAFPVVGGGDQ